MRKKIWVKAMVLAVLSLSLVVLIVFKQEAGPEEEQVKIIEKYYPKQKEGRLIGIKTNQKPSLSKLEAEEDCAMKFDNGKTFDIDCERYLNYQLGEQVKITYDNNELIKIRRK